MLNVVYTLKACMLILYYRVTYASTLPAVTVDINALVGRT